MSMLVVDNKKMKWWERLNETERELDNNIGSMKTQKYDQLKQLTHHTNNNVCEYRLRKTSCAQLYYMILGAKKS
uniref:Uncharacterized protein n=1 Tax=Heterorhabditis bacteriophora TaxID=37862 RepID=A0A1I7XGI4_HETBA